MKTNIAITEGIEIQVKSKFIEEYSSIAHNQYFFEYQIQIENKSPFTVQLLRREWYIFDSLNAPKQVNGDGVIGRTPILQPGEVYTYNSGCQLMSEIGYMMGHYTFKNVNYDNEFPVKIPRFSLIFPGILN